MTRSFSPRVTVRLAVVLATCAIAAMAPGTTWGAWNQPVGGASPINVAADKTVGEPSFANVNGVPFVAWSEEDDGGRLRIRVARLNSAGTDWQEVVGGTNPINHDADEDARKPSIANIGGVPYVAWVEQGSGGQQDLRVARLNSTGTDWEEIGANPIDNDDDASSDSPSLASIAGVPYVAWEEIDAGTNVQIRVARLNSTGTDWEEVVGQASPINHDPNESGENASLADVGGVPHVAWQESDGTNDEIRVARLNSTGTDWEEVVGGASPINKADDKSGHEPSLANVGGVPHVAWWEATGATDFNDELRVARLNSAGTDWEEVVGGANPINHSTNRDAREPSLASIGGVPYVAWPEHDLTNGEIRVARLNAAGDDWEELVGGDSPINHDAQQDAEEPSLASVGGVPHVAWQERGAGNDVQIRVSRLEPEFIGTNAIPHETGATLFSEVRTYGTSLPVGFQYGTGFTSETSTVATSTADSDTVAIGVSGLTPGTTYPFRPFAGTGVGRIFGPVGSFATTPSSQQPQPQPQPQPAPPDPEIQLVQITKLLLAVIQPKFEVRQGRKVKVPYLVTRDASVTLDVRRGGKVVEQVKRARAAANARTGRNTITWNGKIKGKTPKAAKYTLVLKATAADGQTASDTATVRVTKPPRRRRR